MKQVVFHRTWSACLLPTVIALVALVLLGSEAVTGGLEVSWWLLIVSSVGVLSVLSALLAFGDEVCVDDRGIHTRNRLLVALGVSWFGPGRRRSLPWSGIRQIHPFHGAPRPWQRTESDSPKALFVIPHQGARLVLDSMERMPELEALLSRRLPVIARTGPKESL